MDETPIAFADRESDLARMTILQRADGSLVARLRLITDSITPSFQIGEYNDIWRHVKSDGIYVRHDKVLDIETNTWCYEYSSCQDGRLWLRSIDEWHEVIGDHARFEPVMNMRDAV